MHIVKRLIAIACVAAGTLQLTGCIAPKLYVDPALGEPHAANLLKPQDPQPVQLLFEFRTKGNANAAVTDRWRPYIQQQVEQSGLFSKVSNEPVPSARKLMISIDNVPLTPDASQKGFTTGLTFGLVGTTVTDGYVCKFSYLEPGHDTVTKEVHHAIYTTIGNEKSPTGLAPLPPLEAFQTVFRQVVGKGLEEIDQASDIAK